MIAEPKPKRSRAWAAAVLWLASACPAHAQQLPPKDSAALLSRVDALYNHLTTLSTRYTEQYTGMGMSRSESGTLTLKKPGRMLWKYDTPAGKVFVFDGHFAWFYTPGDPQAQRIPAKQLDALHTPLRFLLGHTQLGKELEGVIVSQAGDHLRIVGTPRELADRIRLLTLDVTPAGLITQMKLEEADGAVTLFRFTDIQPNAPATDAEFTFTPPAGVVVVQGTSPI